MGAKATLQIDDGRVKARSYSCVANTRNGACPNNPVESYYFGSDEDGDAFTVRLCRRHNRMYREEAARLDRTIASEHDSGLHGEGDDRKAFADQHIRGEYWKVRCSTCKDEMASEGLGVNPEQVQEALVIQERKDRHERNIAKFIERFTESVEKRGPVSAITGSHDSAVVFEIQDELWKRVQAYMEGAFSWAGSDKMNLVDAYNKVVEEQKQQLINDRIHDEHRSAVSRWVRGADY